ncbi:LuxR C-terminal-related transcriptional regulator [Micromonospora echinofusca]|uniref:Tetratricopeptide repeat protein n=1 Tax=Micromonospora echinofusca TaxID=47858 RepID=A0ABS3VNN0_MICEH|nr:LuxR C-terminal-related transcriptional regulator [Micromonospora echinofusca]MBO4206107.1 tetratricopeptide repeat protein [Micromonospora echinofusca]
MIHNLSPVHQTLIADTPPFRGPFIGRAREMRRLRALLRSTRMLTLVGPGGAGKSRLAVELARRSTGDETVRVVELDALRDESMMHTAVTLAMGGGPAAGPAAAIGRRRTLLVLDGCEHLVDACAELAADLLRRCPNLCILATSRENLRVPAEVTFRVGGLELPAPQERPADRAAAVRLFAEHAERHRPGFQLRRASATVAEICRRLDGLPLGIELAARQLTVMSPDKVLDALDDQLALLAVPERRGPCRHRRMYSTVGWSYRLLDWDERVVFRRLSVLPGGFDAETAKAVCAGPDMPAGRVLPVVCSLLNKSLLTTRTDHDGDRGRFYQWESARAYALHQLAATGEINTVRKQAAEWFGRQAQSLSETLFFADPELDRLRHEPANLAAAADYYTRTGDSERRTLLTVALARISWQQRRHASARKLLASVLPLRLSPRYRSEALVWNALGACVQAEDVDALPLAEQAVRVAHDNPASLAKALDALGFVRMSRRELTEAIETYRDCLDVVRPLGRPLDTAKCQHCLAWAHLLQGELQEAERLLDEVLPVYRALAPRRCQVTALTTLGALRLTQGDQSAATGVFERALRISRPDDDVALDVVDGLALVAAARLDDYRAVCLASAAEALRDRLDLTTSPPWRSWISDATDRARTRLGRMADAAADAGRSLSTDELRSYALTPTTTVDGCGCAGHADMSPGSAGGARDTDRDDPLSQREVQIARLVAGGLTNREIAEQLDVSVRTVCTHLTSIYKKLGLRSRTQAAVWAVRQPQLIPAPEVSPVALPNPVTPS